RRERNNFGASLRAIRWKDGEENQGVERRFVALLDAGREALPVHLRHLVTLLHSSSEPMAIDYLQLFYDLRLWGEPDRRVQKRWAAGFWGFRRDDETSSNEVTTTDQRNDESSED
ncbi:MAG: type I-E CRISPR-associated protein Cse2/CasB, partial [Dehalococcoidia bacterium]|nr:type I-E CRISPR-associated protein Cse2/CasB [Dehalococcoidia bacterium]